MNAFEPSSTLRRLYPEADVGGYTRYDGFVEFYSRVNALLTPGSRVLDFGAGRGQWTDRDALPAYSQHLRAFHERVAFVAGTDVDPVVMTNPTLTEAYTVPPGQRLPFADESFDMVLADHVIEHIQHDHAQGVAGEVMRLLKPGGWFAARTPNKWGIIGVAARAVPNAMHTRVLHKLQPDRKDQDVFPVAYAMNTRKDLRRLFPPPHSLHVYGHASEPRYFGNSVAAWRTASFIDRLTPPRMAPTLMIFVQKGA
ncbi:MAG: class I SAM-dependent methyltransferase [Marmoricola sp.]